MGIGIGRREVLSVIAAVAVGAILGWFWFGDSADRAPDTEFRTLAGERLAVDDFNGRPLIVYFWATDCVTCMREMPDLVELYADLRDRGLGLVAVAMAHDDPEILESVTRQRELPFPVVYDADGEHARAFGNVRVTPTKFLIGPDGRIRMRHIGSTDYHALRSRIEALL